MIKKRILQIALMTLSVFVVKSYAQIPDNAIITNISRHPTSDLIAISTTSDLDTDISVFNIKDCKEEFAINIDNQNDNALEWLPNGNAYAFRSDRDEQDEPPTEPLLDIFLVSEDGTVNNLTSQIDENSYYFDWSFNERYLAINTITPDYPNDILNGEIWLFDSTNADYMQIEAYQDLTMLEPTWFHNEEKLVFLQGSRNIFNLMENTIITILNVEDHTQQLIKTNQTLGGIVLSPDDTTIALTVITDDQDEVVLLDLETEKEIKHLSLEDNSLSVTDWSLNGNLLSLVAQAKDRADIMLYNISDDELINITKNNNGRNRLPIFLSDGNQILYVSNEDNVDEIWIADLSTLESTKLSEFCETSE